MSVLLQLVSWPMLGIALLVFGFAPGALLRVIVLAFLRDDPRRRELLGELYAVPRFERPFWVVEQLEVALIEGLGQRLMRAATGRIIYHWHLGSGVRRVWTAVGGVAMVGLVAGIVFAALHPPLWTSTALVVLPQTPRSAQAATGNGAPDPYAATQEVIAGSNPVLSAALSGVRPAMSLAELRGEAQIGSLAPYVLTVSARGRVAADAEATANAVARSYIIYVSSASSPVGHVEAQMLESTTSATGRSLPVSLLISGGLGALYGAIVGAIGALAFGWADRRFRTSR